MINKRPGEARYPNGIPHDDPIYAQDSHTGEYVLIWSEKKAGDPAEWPPRLCVGPVETPEQEAGLAAAILRGTLRLVNLPENWKSLEDGAFGSFVDARKPRTKRL
jgi:hypothetical protein